MLKKQFTSVLEKMIISSKENLRKLKEIYETEIKNVNRYYHQSNIELARENKKLYKKILNLNVRLCEKMVNDFIKDNNPIKSKVSLTDFSRFLIE